MLRFTVSRQAKKERLDRFLCAHTSYSRTQIQKAILAGCVSIDTVRCLIPKYSLQEKQIICFSPPKPIPSRVHPENLSLEIFYEDKDLIVFEKPSGMVVHPSLGHPNHTLVNALLHHCQDLSGIGGVLTPGIVHRLDRGTSGVMVAAKSDRGHQGLSKLFQEHDLDRRYQAIVYGIPPKKTRYDTLHGKSSADSKRFTTKVSRGKRAITALKVLEKLQKFSLVEAQLFTGRTHQIRVHLFENGFPLLGDSLYSQKTSDSSLFPFLDRPALHAAVLGFRHPITGQSLLFHSKLPQDLSLLLQTLRNTVS